MVVYEVTDQATIQKILDGSLLTTSVGSRTDSFHCSVCGANWMDEKEFFDCIVEQGHARGKTYDGQLMYLKVGTFENIENSFVTVPADQRAGVRRPSIQVGLGGEMYHISDPSLLKRLTTSIHLVDGFKESVSMADNPTLGQLFGLPEDHERFIEKGPWTTEELSSFNEKDFALSGRRIPLTDPSLIESLMVDSIWVGSEEEVSDDADQAGDGSPLEHGVDEVVESENAEEDTTSEEVSESNPTEDSPNEEITERSSDLSLHSNRNRAWDGNAARNRMLDHAVSDGTIGVDKASQGFALVTGDPQNRGSYKLPFADIISGEKVVVYSGVVAALQMVSKVKGASEDEKSAAQKFLETQKERFGNDDSEEGCQISDLTQENFDLREQLHESHEAEESLQAQVDELSRTVEEFQSKMGTYEQAEAHVLAESVAKIRFKRGEVTDEAATFELLSNRSLDSLRDTFSDLLERTAPPIMDTQSEAVKPEITLEEVKGLIARYHSLDGVPVLGEEQGMNVATEQAEQTALVEEEDEVVTLAVTESGEYFTYFGLPANALTQLGDLP